MHEEEQRRARTNTSERKSLDLHWELFLAAKNAFFEAKRKDSQRRLLGEGGQEGTPATAVCDV